MNIEQSRSLVRELFQQKFDKSRFRTFMINLLNHVDESQARKWEQTSIKDAFKNRVRAYERLGTYTSPEKDKLDVLIVYLTTNTKLRHARTALRNFVAEHLKTDGNKEAALVAFMSRSEKQWRFSYVTMEYDAVKTEDGKVGVETRLTPARRSSYLVGEDESCHTAQSRFLGLLQDTENHPTLAQIEDAFSVEAVTKEFFEQYQTLFLDLKDELDSLVKKDRTIRAEFAAKGVNTADFAKKLMGQIVFLYFLQKKGWLGVSKGHEWGSGPHDFVRRLARQEFGSHDNFFNDVLESLFYDSLATDRGHDAWSSRFDCRIPFLNGGLFDPLDDYDWRKTNITLLNELFTNTEVNEAGDIGTGILDIFDRYNFTINEAEPLEKEVAIDPEMLGKVFENLIEENRRKGLGSYYTPREIVHYMCQESMISYLDTMINRNKELISRHDIVTFVHLGDQISHYEDVDARCPIKMPKSVEQHARLIDEHLAAITVCDPAVGSGAFPVGMMIEIVRQRSALTPYFNDVHERTPYEFKRHAIQNCLYGVDIDPGAVEIAKLRLWLSLVVDEDNVQQIKPLPNLDYKIVSGNSLVGFSFKTKRLDEVESLKQRFFDEAIQERKADLKSQIDKKIAECFAAAKRSFGYDITFDYEVLFSEVFQSRGGFDVVIGNPPYVSYGLRGGQKLTQDEKQFLKHSFRDSAEYKISLYAVFMEKAVRLCHRKGGVNSFIVPDSFLLGMYFSKIRNFISRQCEMHYILLLPFSVFKAVVGFSVVYQFARREQIREAHRITARTAAHLEAVGKKLFREHSYPQRYFQNERKTQFRLFFDPQTKALVEKCRDKARPLELIISFRSGLIGKKGQAAIISRTQHNTNWRSGIVSGREIRRYSVTPKGNYLLYESTAIKSGYQNVDYFKPKLFMRQTGDSLVCAYDEDNLLCLNNVHVGNVVEKAVDVKFLLALLNSKLLNWFYQTIALEVGRVMAQTDIATLNDLPIRLAPDQKQLAELAHRSLVAKRKDPEADVSGWECEIDELVYKLYGLTAAEKAIVEAETDE